MKLILERERERERERDGEDWKKRCVCVGGGEEAIERKTDREI